MKENYKKEVTKKKFMHYNFKNSIFKVYDFEGERKCYFICFANPTDWLKTKIAIKILREIFEAVLLFQALLSFYDIFLDCQFLFYFQHSYFQKFSMSHLHALFNYIYLYINKFQLYFSKYRGLLLPFTLHV